MSDLPGLPFFIPKFKKLLPFASALSSIIAEFREENFEQFQTEIIQYLFDSIIKEMQGLKGSSNLNDLTMLIAAETKLQFNFPQFFRNYSYTQNSSTTKPGTNIITITRTACSQTIIDSTEILLTILPLDNTPHNLPIYVMLINTLMELLKTFYQKNIKLYETHSLEILNKCSKRTKDYLNAFTKMENEAQNIFAHYNSWKNKNTITTFMEVSTSLAAAAYSLIKLIDNDKDTCGFPPTNLRMFNKFLIHTYRICELIKWSCQGYLFCTLDCMLKILKFSYEVMQNQQIAAIYKRVRDIVTTSKSYLFYGPLGGYYLAGQTAEVYFQIKEQIKFFAARSTQNQSFYSLFIVYQALCYHLDASLALTNAAISIPPVKSEFVSPIIKSSLNYCNDYLKELVNLCNTDDDSNGTYFPALSLALASRPFFLALGFVADKNYLLLYARCITSTLFASLRLSMGDTGLRSQINSCCNYLEDIYSQMHHTSRDASHTLFKSPTIDLPLRYHDVESANLVYGFFFDFRHPSSGKYEELNYIEFMRTTVTAVKSLCGDIPRYCKSMNKPKKPAYTPMAPMIVQEGNTIKPINAAIPKNDRTIMMPVTPQQQQPAPKFEEYLDEDQEMIVDVAPAVITAMENEPMDDIPDFELEKFDDITKAPDVNIFGI
ncbi:hypothetical protein TVAG_208760 [Trichomonas vaginalis G3]|uniref:Uncharacterized protein n=1 Tax=Trichomonas vaginalis (strain ATCC PRA-98 / G3) TaxID=412133 RepID=A2DVB8_TRIV3|nr:hypothetical protein TVAGG3_0335060 [Trichomonas vaginalis G3]EAY15597.1 hypothetical protein TVAG_208760 [Trichomonas vaginalis G3]KAI5530205.1 hypothetical protein TVAGG3_0335060 [Trichomonas vaginalis G3]|eukprot:XP_001327820.1 hypothetical protein [Trichomonas vaginalis G3]